MKSVIKTRFGLFLSLFLVISFCIHSVEAQPVLITMDVDIENDQSSMDSKSIDDLLEFGYSPPVAIIAIKVFSLKL